MCSFVPTTIAETINDNTLTASLIDLMKRDHINIVSYVIINDYKISESNNLSLDPKIKVTHNSLFQAASLSKSLSAFAILQLVAEHKIDLDQSVNDQLTNWHIPKSTFPSIPTVRQCLNMTSGLCYSKFEAIFPPYLQGQPLPSLRNILEGTPPATNYPVKICINPGSFYFYSGAGYQVLQQLVEEKTHQPFAQYMNNHILPLFKMNHSIFEYPLNKPWDTNTIPGFNAKGEMNKNGWDNNASTASAGLWTNPSEMAKFLLTITNAYVEKNSSSSLHSIAMEMINQKENSPFSLGIKIDGENRSLNFRKNGSNTGYQNEFLMFPNTGQGIVIMTNSASGLQLINDFIAIVAKQYHWPKYSLQFNEIISKPLKLT